MTDVHHANAANKINIFAAFNIPQACATGLGVVSAAVPPALVAAYDEVFPLADGWRDRIALWQLYPLAAHACLFGGGYGAQC